MAENEVVPSGGVITHEAGVLVFAFDVAAGGNEPIAQSIRMGINFRLMGLTGSSTGDYNLQIRCPQSRRQFLTPTPVNADNLVGTAQLPFFFPVTFTFIEKTEVEIEVWDTSGAPNAIELVLIGEYYETNPRSGEL